MKKLFLGLLLTLGMSSCLMESGFRFYFNEFTVKKGDHKFKEDRVGLIYIKPFVKFKGTSTFHASFNKSCFYDKSLLGADSMDINKLYGLADCNAKHQSHSVRIGWRPIDDQFMELFAYVYSDKERIIETIGSVTPHEQFSVKIDLYGDYYDIWYKGRQIKLPRHKKCNSGSYFRLFPYFGGNQPAPQNMELWLYESD